MEKADTSSGQQAKEEQLQLRSADGIITFLNDRLEVNNLLGSKVRDVLYSQIEEVDFEKTSSAVKDAAVAMTHGPMQAAANSKRLIIRTAVDEYNLDFRLQIVRSDYFLRYCHQTI